jgi:hypothetical protein
MTKRYIEIIKDFVEHRIDVENFESTFLEMFKNEKEDIPENVYCVLDSFFSDVDMLVLDESLRENGDLNEVQLRESAKKTLYSLNKFAL